MVNSRDTGLTENHSRLPRQTITANYKVTSPNTYYLTTLNFACCSCLKTSSTSPHVVLPGLYLVGTNKTLYCRIYSLKADQLVTINSTVPFHQRYPQRSNYRLTQDLSSVRRRIHNHRHIKILRASLYFHAPNEDIAHSVRNSQRLHFTTLIRRPYVDNCLLSQQRRVVDRYQQTALTSKMTLPDKSLRRTEIPSFFYISQWGLVHHNWYRYPSRQPKHAILYCTEDVVRYLQSGTCTRCRISCCAYSRRCRYHSYTRFLRFRLEYVQWRAI
ncbi:hypothetical protein PoB_001792400 [Plakobranchus ocellatus]|uniref:Uncharacterized protein n=1 Tax=Plakobranchus ocellatus TaxID=259542 RepID=A0AAV3ZBS7_9GAST|nr:hypothetical protein PoB_001792400 [Plakobranchus ocellatus]